MAACLHLPRGLRWTQVPRDGRGACFLAAAPGASTRELSLFVCFFFPIRPGMPILGPSGVFMEPQSGEGIRDQAWARPCKAGSGLF